MRNGHKIPSCIHFGNEIPTVTKKLQILILSMI